MIVWAEDRWRSWPYLQLAAALGRVAPVPHLGSIIALALIM